MTMPLSADRICHIVRASLFALCLAWPQISFAVTPPHSATDHVTLSAENASDDMRQIVAWVLSTNDNHGMPFVIIDKVNAQALAFNPQGSLVGAAPVLLGAAHGDISPPGIGELALASITPGQRITPAGRFVAALGVNLGGKQILWVDYAAALSFHPVIVGKISDHRFRRLATATAKDNRISYGCINVPAAFFSDVVRPLFNATAGVVYILPESQSADAALFKSQSPRHAGVQP